MRTLIIGSWTNKLFWVNMIVFLFGYSCLGLPGFIHARVYICALSLLTAAVIFYDNLKRRYHTTLTLYIFFLTCLALITSSFNEGKATGMVLDSTVSTSMLFSIYMMKFPPETIVKYFKIACIASVVYFIITFLYNPLAIDDVVSRGAISTASFTATSMCWPMAFVVLLGTSVKKNDKNAFIIFYVFWALCIVFNMMYLKRAVFVDSAFLIISLIWLHKRIYHKNVFKTAFIIILSAVIIVLLVYVVFQYIFHFDLYVIVERTLQRFDQIDVTGTVRFDESENYFSRASIFDILVGKGFGVAHHGLGFEKTNTALHIGFNNLILKHGVFLIIPYVFMVISVLFKAVKTNVNKYYDPLRMTCIAYVIATVPTFIFYTNFWATCPIYCTMWYSIFYAYYGPKR